MARYVTRIESRLSPAEAFAYMADFTNARFWDPSVSLAELRGDRPIGLGAVFHLVSRFAGRDVPLLYTIVTFEPPQRVVLESRKAGFTSRDTITIEPAGAGSVLHYDALLELLVEVGAPAAERLCVVEPDLLDVLHGQARGGGHRPRQLGE